MVGLALHGADTAVLVFKSVCDATRWHTDQGTYSEEDPLQHLAVAVGILLLVERELVVLVVVLLEVEQDRGGLEDGEVVARAVNERRDAAVGVQLDEPRLLLRVLAKIDLLDAVDCSRLARKSKSY